MSKKQFEKELYTPKNKDKMGKNEFAQNIFKNALFKNNKK